MSKFTPDRDFINNLGRVHSFKSKLKKKQYDKITIYCIWHLRDQKVLNELSRVAKINNFIDNKLIY